MASPWQSLCKLILHKDISQYIANYCIVLWCEQESLTINIDDVAKIMFLNSYLVIKLRLFDPS